MPVGPAADDDDVERSVLDELRPLVGLFPAAQNVVLEPDRIGQGVEGKRMVRRPFDAEEIDLRPEPEDEVVVGQRLELLERHLAGIQVDGRDQVLVDPRVVLVVEEVADRVADGRLLEQARRHLVQQRLERVVVVLVHDDDLDVALLQLLRSADSGEASAEDEDEGSAVAVVGTGHEAKVRRPARMPVHPEGMIGLRRSFRPSDFRPWVRPIVCATSGVESVSGHGNNFARARASWIIANGTMRVWSPKSTLA